MTRVSAVFVMPGLAPDDLVELDAALSFLHRHDTLSALTVMLPDLTAGERHAIAANCRLSHTALLLCPRDLAELTQALDERGLTAGPDIPSTVVRQRLAGRYGRPASRLDVRIVHAPVPVADDVDYTVEIFALLPVPGTRIDEIISAEREFGHERHVALAADTRDEVILNGLRALLIGRGRLHSDGGGYNPVEDVTVLYFRAGSEGQRPYRRLELRCGGKHPELMAAHLTASQDAPTRLLRLLTGAWATQALAVTVTLGVADQLAARPGYPIDELARDIAADPDALHRLLRYLRELGIVTPTPDGIGYTLTELGALLPVTAPQSLHPLARLYGGDFYESFGRLEYAVRTGQPAFDEHFGRHHFEYFSADPERAELFDAAMAASASIFGQIAQLIDLSAARTVVDVVAAMVRCWRVCCGRLRICAESCSNAKAPCGWREVRWIGPGVCRKPLWCRVISPRRYPVAATSTSCPGYCMTGTTTPAAPFCGAARRPCPRMRVCMSSNAYCRRMIRPHSPRRGMCTCCAMWAGVSAP